jgi:hypothetical protein
MFLKRPGTKRFMHDSWRTTSEADFKINFNDLKMERGVDINKEE